MKIALLGNSFIGWGGGIDFLRNLANALLQHEGHTDHKVYLLIPEDSVFVETIRNLLRSWMYVAIDISNARKPIYRKVVPLDKNVVLNSFQNVEGNIEIVIYKNNRRSLMSCLERMSVDIIIPSAIPLGRHFPVPWIGYIYDFQHKYYPEFFSREVRYKRDVLFKKILTEARAVIVNSIAVKDDIKKYVPEANCEIFNLPFAPVPVMSWFEESGGDVLSTYQLPRRYFLISNQFWIHKSHITAFEALKQFRDKTGLDVSIVCTGNTFDIRFPNYFPQLQKQITEMGIGEFVHFLGFIPKEDQIKIMRHSLAVLQPTLFEGGPGGGSVFDAVAMGVPAIISDIPINREVVNDNLLFFQAGSAADLAEKMSSIMLSEKQFFIDKDELMHRGRVRSEALGKRLYQAIKYVTAYNG